MEIITSKHAAALVLVSKAKSKVKIQFLSS